MATKKSNKVDKQLDTLVKYICRNHFSCRSRMDVLEWSKDEPTVKDHPKLKAALRILFPRWAVDLSRWIIKEEFPSRDDALEEISRRFTDELTPEKRFIKEYLMFRLDVHYKPSSYVSESSRERSVDLNAAYREHGRKFDGKTRLTNDDSVPTLRASAVRNLVHAITSRQYTSRLTATAAICDAKSTYNLDESSVSELVSAVNDHYPLEPVAAASQPTDKPFVSMEDATDMNGQFTAHAMNMMMQSITNKEYSDRKTALVAVQLAKSTYHFDASSVADLTMAVEKYYPIQVSMGCSIGSSTCGCSKEEPVPDDSDKVQDMVMALHNRKYNFRQQAIQVVEVFLNKNRLVKSDEDRIIAALGENYPIRDLEGTPAAATRPEPPFENRFDPRYREAFGLLYGKNPNPVGAADGCSDAPFDVKTSFTESEKKYSDECEECDNCDCTEKHEKEEHTVFTHKRYTADILLDMLEDIPLLSENVVVQHMHEVVIASAYTVVRIIDAFENMYLRLRNK